MWRCLNGLDQKESFRHIKKGNLERTQEKEKESCQSTHPALKLEGESDKMDLYRLYIIHIYMNCIINTFTLCF